MALGRCSGSSERGPAATVTEAVVEFLRPPCSFSDRTSPRAQQLYSPSKGRQDRLDAIETSSLRSSASRSI
jgi:hypothetical protein